MKGGIDMEEKKTVLIIDDSVGTQALNKFVLKNNFNVLLSYTEKEAVELFRANLKNIDCIVMDACLSGDEIDTIPLISKFREAHYTGPIIATSANPCFQDELVKAGCDCKSDKGIPLFQKLYQIFNIIPEKQCEI